MIKTISITVAIAMVVGFSGTLLTLFGPNTLTAQYWKFAIMLLLFVVIMVGAYWFVFMPTGNNGRRENQSGTETEGDARES